MSLTEQLVCFAKSFPSLRASCLGKRRRRTKITVQLVVVCERAASKVGIQQQLEKTQVTLILILILKAVLKPPYFVFSACTSVTSISILTWSSEGWRRADSAGRPV